MKSVIKLDVQDYQIGQEVTVYFKDTMMKKGIAEAEPINAIRELEKVKSELLINYSIGDTIRTSDVVHLLNEHISSCKRKE